MSDVRPFVHALNVSDGSATVIPTTAALLRAQSFLDGRSDFSEGDAQVVERWSAPTNPAPDEPDRFIFHVGFCGSTLLSRLLDHPGRSLVLREPNCLADLANQANADGGSAAPGMDLSAALNSLCGALRMPWTPGESVVVKPSNWCNRLLPLLIDRAPEPRVVLMTMSRAAYLDAVLRGGPERMNFVARLALNLSHADSEFPRFVADSLVHDDDRFAQLMALAATAHAMQTILLRAAAVAWPDSVMLDFAELVANPAAATRQAASALGLSLDHARIERDCLRWSGRHAKQPDRLFSAPAEAQAHEAFDDRQRDVLAGVLAWATRNFGD